MADSRVQGAFAGSDDGQVPTMTMTSDALQSFLPRLRGSGRTSVPRTLAARDSVRVGATALRGMVVLSAVVGAVGGIMIALALLCLTTMVMLGLFGGAFFALPVLHAFSGK